MYLIKPEDQEYMSTEAIIAFVSTYPKETEGWRKLLFAIRSAPQYPHNGDAVQHMRLHFN